MNEEFLSVGINCQIIWAVRHKFFWLGEKVFGGVLVIMPDRVIATENPPTPENVNEKWGGTDTIADVLDGLHKLCE